MSRFGLDILIDNLPDALKKKKLGVVCHAASINSHYHHIIDLLAQRSDITLTAIFGPQHGLYGQTQDNMVEWEGELHPVLKIPVYSLYGATRKPTAAMLEGIDCLLFDVQDVGARPYTYIWTLKLCMQACAEQGISLWVLDRPNPISGLSVDGPLLDDEYFSFVGGAPIPLCHRLTMGEMARLLHKLYFPQVELKVQWMEGWWRNSFWPQTGLPWVMPSPNMPTFDTALVYPGQVLLEATNISEARGTTRPFELFGAPYLDPKAFLKAVEKHGVSGCIFREHAFIPSFQKWGGSFCNGFQIHVTNTREFNPVETTVAVISAIKKTAIQEKFEWKQPPYEYEYEKMPFDILAGNTELRDAIEDGVSAREVRAFWCSQYGPFEEMMSSLTFYPEEL